MARQMRWLGWWPCPLCPCNSAYAMEQQGDAFGEGQGCHEPVDLVDIVPRKGGMEELGTTQVLTPGPERDGVMWERPPPNWDSPTLRVPAENGHPEDARGQEAGGHDHVEVEERHLRGG